MTDILLPANIAVCLAYLVKGVTGFGNTLVFSAVLGFFTANRNITPVDLLLGLPANGWMAWKGRKTIRARVVAPLLAALAVGMVPGALLLKQGDDRGIKLLLGVAILALAVEMALRRRQKAPKAQNRVLLLAIGVASGLLCGLFGIGAFLVAYVSRTTTNGEEMRSNLCFVFLGENLLRVVLYAVLGLLTPAVVLGALSLVPGMLLGLGGGLLLGRRLPEKAVRGFTVVMLLLMGVSVIANNL